MIEATELRIGNIFERPSGKMVVVSEIHAKGFIYDDDKLGSGSGGWQTYDGKYLKKAKLGIYLDKFGFEEIEVPKGKASSCIMKLGSFEIEFSTGCWWINNYKGSYTSINYVHNLQNLYYGLKQKDLKFKIKK